MFKKENIKKYAPDFLRVTAISLVLGVVCGLIGVLFVKSISLVTSLRENNGWILYLLPVLGVMVVLLYKYLKVSGIGTNHIIKSVRTEEKVSPLLSVAVFFGATLSHFGGASVGREGAALQLGGSIGEFFAEKFKTTEDYRRVLVMSGMAGFFSALFGTPIAAFVFVLEVARIGKRTFMSIIPVFLSSITAFFISNRLGVEGEHFPVSNIPSITTEFLWKFVLIAVLGALVSCAFVYALHFSEKIFKKLFKNDYLRIVLGGLLVVALAKILDTTDYNGGGINIVHNVFTHNEVNYEAFLLKIIFTAISVGSGYKGGEIVPTIFIGGTLGGTLAKLVGIDMSFGGAIGITALFSGVTNCPFATIVLACEMFGVKGIGYFAVASIISFALSGKVSLYEGGKLPFVNKS